MSSARFRSVMLVCDFRRADDFSRGISNRRDRQRNINETPILPPTHGFVEFHPIAPANAINDLVLFFLAIRRDQDGNRFAYYLFGGVTKQTRGALIPRLYDPV